MIVIGAAVGAGAAIADMQEKSEHGMLTTKDVVLDLLSIASSLAAAGGALGKFFMAEALATGRFASLAALSGRLAAPLRVGGLSADLSRSPSSPPTPGSSTKMSASSPIPTARVAQMRLLGNFLKSPADEHFVAIKQEVNIRRAGADIHLGPREGRRLTGREALPRPTGAAGGRVTRTTTRS